MGGSCSEKAYQTALLYNLYDLKVPGLIERPIYITTKGMSVLAGYVDMELDSRFVLELKISPPTIVNLRKDKKQLRRYISAYKTNGIQLERAALVYFGNNEVRVVEVSVKPEDNRMVPYWNFDFDLRVVEVSVKPEDNRMVPYWNFDFDFDLVIY
jgi:CRISPR/Cas system-associated exonuclease Cas4 (RecB family)